MYNTQGLYNLNNIYIIHVINKIPDNATLTKLYNEVYKKLKHTEIDVLALEK